MPTAIEEFLRAYAPVTMARLVAQDFDFHGCPMKEGDWVLLPFPSANRDSAAFADPDDVRIDREADRHAASGLGVHRCLGSNLGPHGAQGGPGGMVGPLPGFRLATPSAVTWSAGQVRGPRSLPLSIASSAGG